MRQLKQTMKIRRCKHPTRLLEILPVRRLQYIDEGGGLITVAVELVLVETLDRRWESGRAWFYIHTIDGLSSFGRCIRGAVDHAVQLPGIGNGHAERRRNGAAHGPVHREVLSGAIGI